MSEQQPVHELADANAVDNASRTLDGIVVSKVYSANSVADVSKVLCDAHDAGESVIPWGGGTMMGLGNVPSAADIVLDVTSLNQILTYDPDDMTISIQAGCRLGDVQRLLADHHQRLPFDAADPDHATIGGLFCTGVSGPTSSAYGSMRDLVIGITTVLPNGQQSRGGGMVVKNVSGYDMMRMHYGALGSLGVVVQLNFKVLPAPRNVRTVIVRFDSVSDATKAANAVKGSQLLPSAMVMVNDLLADGIGLGAAAWSLLLRADGPSQALGRQVERLVQTANAQLGDVTVTDDAASLELWEKINQELSTAPSENSVRLRIGSEPSKMERAVEELQSLAEQHELGMSITADVGYGQILTSFATGDSGTGAFSAAWNTARQIGRHVTLLTGPAAVKSNIDVFGDEPAGLPLMRSLKQQFDPSGVLNHGRFIGHL